MCLATLTLLMTQLVAQAHLVYSIDLNPNVRIAPLPKQTDAISYVQKQDIVFAPHMCDSPPLMQKKVMGHELGHIANYVWFGIRSLYVTDTEIYADMFSSNLMSSTEKTEVLGVIPDEGRRLRWQQALERNGK